jgi:hypothetical protein
MNKRNCLRGLSAAAFGALLTLAGAAAQAQAPTKLEWAHVY